MKTWLEQKELDLLVVSGFAELDEAQTQHNKEYFAAIGGGVGNEYLLRPMYRWTPEGKAACHRYRYTTPMAYAKDMHENTIRHCIHCGRVTAGFPTGAKHLRGSQWQRNRTVCVKCHRAGKQLED